MEDKESFSTQEQQQPQIQVTEPVTIDPALLCTMMDIMKKATQNVDDPSQLTPETATLDNLKATIPEQTKTEEKQEDDDEFFETVLQIQKFFKKQFSIPAILNIIHKSAGDVKKAVHTLAKTTSRLSSFPDFSYHTVCTDDNHQIEAYFV